MRGRRRLLLRVALAGAVVCLFSAGPGALRGASEQIVRVETLAPPDVDFSDAPGVLRLMTLNAAHGRGLARNQSLLKKNSIENNLVAISDVLVRESPHIVALQEADGPSAWSGSFDHVRFLARAAGFGQFLRGEHVAGLGLSYGTALLSRLPLHDGASITFPARSIGPTKGFVISTVSWPGAPGVEVDVVSVHLDFLNDRTRQRQIERMIEVLAERSNPMVVMGDFNCSFQPETPLALFADALQLTAHAPDAADLATFASGARIDWILVSDELEFLAYETLPDLVSDHRAVVAEIALTAR